MSSAAEPWEDQVRIRTLFSSLGVVLAAVALAVPAASAAPAPGPVTPACAWDELSVTTTNESAPDSAEAEWLLPFTVQDGLHIRLDGRYPDSRYAALQAYDSTGLPYTVDGVSSALTDYQVQPDAGSVNPWQRSPGRHQRAGHAFTVSLQSDVTPGQANTLPLAPAGTTPGTAGYLFYRVYLPAGGDFSRVPLPVVTFTLDGVSQQVPACPPGTATAPTAPAPASAAAGPHPDATAPAPRFARIVFSGGFPNADTAYLSTEVTPPTNGDVLVIRGKAPTAPRGSHPSPWPAASIDLRYWSLCDYPETGPYPVVANPLPGGKIDYGCRYDNQIATDRRGDYTFVVGTEAQRRAIDRIPGATFLPFSTAYPTTKHMLLLRNTLASAGFAQAVQNVPRSGSPASAAAAMGRYYPRTAICPLSMLVRSGPGTCLAGTP